MSKRKRSPKEGTPSTPAEDSEGVPAVHVTSDMLAGSTDIFAPGEDKAAKYARFPDSIPNAIITQAASRNAPTGTSACWLAANPTKQGVASSVNALSDGHGAPRSSAVARTATASPASRYEAPAGTQTGCARTSWNPCATIPGTSSG